jgi:enoyl-CoA hydratase/carnithine racemase
MTELVLRHDDKGITTLTLNRPDVLNALNPALFGELRAHIDALASAPAAAALIVLRGAGRSFSAGNDLKAIAAGETAPTPRYQAETITALEALPQPTVAAVHGHCYTGGLELALACDFIIAAGSARFADTHGKWGMTPTWGLSQRLPRRVGAARAKELMFTGRPIDGEEAAAIGLANRCVPDDELDETIRSMGTAIADNSWFTSRLDKLLIRAGADLTLSEGLAYEAEHSPGAGPDMHDRLNISTKDSSG